MQVFFLGLVLRQITRWPLCVAVFPEGRGRKSSRCKSSRCGPAECSEEHGDENEEKIERVVKNRGSDIGSKPLIELTCSFLTSARFITFVKISDHVGLLDWSPG